MRIAKIALAVAGTLVAGSVFAQSSVTAYGRIDTYIGNTKSLNSGTGLYESVSGMTSGGIGASRWGLKGSEDLGSGLKANFMLEQGFASDTGAASRFTPPGSSTETTGFNRQAWVGLSGNWGEIRFGNAYAAIDDIWGASNSGFDSNFDATDNVWVDGYSNQANMIRYTTPSMGGFTLGVSHSMDERASASNSTGVKGTGLFLAYANGPLAVNLGYHTEDQAAAPAAGAQKIKSTMLNGSYDLGVAKLLASYARVDNYGSGTLDARQWQVGVDVPVSAALTVTAGYSSRKDSQTTGLKGSGLVLAGKYDLSKRTSLYGFYHDSDTELRNTAAKQSDVRVYGAGIVHLF